MQTPIVQGFKIVKYKFTLEVLSTIKLPPYAGSTLRGAFGNAFKNIACTRKDISDCKTCEIQKDCPFFVIYENTGEFSRLNLSRFKTPPKPFIFEPPMSTIPQFYQKGQQLLCNLVLIGHSLKYLPHFIIAFKEMGKQGMGKGRGQFLLKQVEGINLVSNEKRVIYSREADSIANENTTFTLSDFIQVKTQKGKKINRMRMEFISPTRIKSSGSYGNPLSFKVLIQTLFTRISNLAYNYCDQSHILNFRDIVNYANDVEVAVEKKQWQDIRRFQTQNNIEMFLGGYIGSITYTGDLTPFWPWLQLGEIIHVGKNCAFGLGQFQVFAQAE